MFGRGLKTKNILRLATMLLTVMVIMPDSQWVKPQHYRTAFEFSPEKQAADLLASMTLEQKIGQMFMVSAYGSMNDTTATF